MSRLSLRENLTLLFRLGVGVVLVYAALALYKRVLFPVLVRVVELSPGTVRVAGPLGSLAAAAIAYALYVRWLERRRADELALRLLPQVGAAALGAALISLTIGGLFFSGHYVLESARPLSAAAPVVCAILAAATIEEFVFRGLLFRTLEKIVGTSGARTPTGSARVLQGGTVTRARRVDFAILGLTQMALR